MLFQTGTHYIISNINTQGKTIFYLFFIGFKACIFHYAGNTGFTVLEKREWRRVFELIVKEGSEIRLGKYRVRNKMVCVPVRTYRKIGLVERCCRHGRNE